MATSSIYPNQVHTKIIQTTSAIEVSGNGGMKEIAPMNSVIGDGTFLSATLLSGTTAGLAYLVLHETVWGNTSYLSASNPSNSAFTIPSGMSVKVSYLI